MDYSALAKADVIDFLETYVDTINAIPLDKYDLVAFIHDFIQQLEEHLSEELDSYVPTDEWLCYAEDAVLNMYEFWKLAAAPPLSVPATPEQQAHVQYLRSVPQFQQRSRNWYEQTRNTLTASEISKIVGTPGVRNALIRSKCIAPPAVPTPEEADAEAATVLAAAAAQERILADWGECLAPGAATNDPRFWGQRYEPVAKQIYTLVTGQRLFDYGRILHPYVPRLGASPDAIEAERCFNVEFKCVVSRVLDGEIPWEYYCQMQSQMECCGLDWSSFVETKFTEVELLKSLPDTATTYTSLDASLTIPTYMGCIWFVAHVSAPETYYYVYSPVFTTADAIRKWDAEKHVPEGWSVEAKRHWIVEQFELQYVPRNRKWFEDMKPEIEQFWHDVEYYRFNGCDNILPRRTSTKKPKADDMTCPEWDVIDV